MHLIKIPDVDSIPLGIISQNTKPMSKLFPNPQAFWADLYMTVIEFYNPLKLNFFYEI